MLGPAGVQRVVRSLPDAVEQDHHGRPSFRVGGRIFATLWDAQHLNVMLETDRIRAAVRDHPNICEEVWWGQRLSAVRVDLRKANATLVRQLLAEAWHRRST